MDIYLKSNPHSLVPFWKKQGVFEVAQQGLVYGVPAKNVPVMSANGSEHLQSMLLL